MNNDDTISIEISYSSSSNDNPKEQNPNNNDNNNNILNYKFENKEIEELSNNFVEDLFKTNPIPLVQKHKSIDSNKENDNQNKSKKKSSNVQKGDPGLNEVCQDFVNDIFDEKNRREHELEKAQTVYREELNEKDKFQMAPDEEQFFSKHINEIINIQKNWKKYFDMNKFKLLKSKSLIIQQYYRKYLIQKYGLPNNFYYNDKFLKMQTELYEDTYKKNLSILFPSLFMDKTDLNEFASNMLEMANNPIHYPYENGKVFLFAKILDFDMMIDTSECYETLWAEIYDSIYTKCLQNNDPIQLISLGSQHTLCVTNKGKIYTFGWNNYGQCGVPINSTIILKNELKNNKLININKFNEINLRVINRVDGVKIPQIDQVLYSSSITCGEDYSLIVDKEGKLYSFGINLNGQLGLGHTEQIEKPSEVKLSKNVKFSQVKSAGYINFCTTENGEIYMWPYTDKKGNINYSPGKFNLLTNQEKIISISCGNNFCILLNNNGMVYSMGKSNKYGELGVGDHKPRYGPTPIDFFLLNSERISQISCGFKHCVAKSVTGRAYTWGCGCKGQLGQDNYNNMSIPGLVKFENSFMKIFQVSAGFRCTFFLSDNRKVYSCGCNGTISMEKTPVLFDIVDKVPEMSLEQNYSIVKINNAFCKSFSIFYATVADTTTLKLSPVRINNILNNLASKWNSDKINPPYIETIENFFPNYMKKPKDKEKEKF